MPRILLVEDNEMNREMLCRRLNRRGYDVLTAVDGQQAVDTTRLARPDLVLMDMDLPIKDGWSASRELKQMEETRAIPIIALTAHAMEADRDRALAAGCEAFQSKPIDLPALLSQIEQLLDAAP